MSKNGWVTISSRAKYVFDNTEVYICLDGRFHSWASYDYKAKHGFVWGVRTVQDPQVSFGISRIENWFDKISEDEK